MSWRVRLIGAGAGSGKTTRVVQELMERLLPPDGSEGVPPSGILATTFTKKAAAELIERVREELIGRGREDLAGRIGEGLIGTVDSVSGELVRRFAFDVGLPPRLQSLEEEGAYRAFAEALALRLTSERLETMHRAERAFALPTAEEGEGGRRWRRGRTWRKTVSEIVARARENALGPVDLKQCARRSLEGLDRLLGPLASSSEALDAALSSALSLALAAIAANGDETKGTAEYLELLRDSAAALQEERLDWKRWAELAKKVPTRKSVAASAPVRDAAAAHFAHPRLRAQLTEFIDTLFELAAESLETYEEWKRQRHLLDFIDMEAKALELLGQPAVAERLGERLRLVLVDEFQDTSPLQLALFLKLADIAPESIWVGDPKQAIYGFRGTDPSLMQSAVAALPPPGPEDRQRTSYRSRKQLVDLVSHLFVPAFEGVLPPEQVVLDAHRGEEPELGPALYHWPIAVKQERRPKPSAVAAGVARLLGRGGAQPALVREGKDGPVRPARPADVAVLSRNNSRCQAISKELEALGVRAAIQRTGLLSTPEAALVMACLRRLVDRRDTLATAEIVSLTEVDPGQAGWLAERLAYLETGQPPELWRRTHPIVAALDRLEPSLALLSPTEVLDRVLDAAGAPLRVAAWGHAEVRHGNLEALRRWASAYEDGCGRSHAGASVVGLVHWLEQLAASGRDRQSQGVGPDAVQVLTVHGSKGLEWPIVVLAETDWQYKADIFAVETVGREGSMDLNDPLFGRWVRYWPWPYGDLSQVDGLSQRIEAMPVHAHWESSARGEAVRLLYVAMTRARDALVLPTMLKSKSAQPQHAWLDLVLSSGEEGGSRLSSDPGENPLWLPGGGKPVTVLTQDPGEAEDSVRLQPPPPEWFRPGRPAEQFPPAHRAISGLEPPPGESVEIGAPIPLGTPLRHAADLPWAGLGDALHAVLAADDIAAPAGERLAQAASLLERYLPDAPRAVDPSALLIRSEQLTSKLKELHGPGALFREWPVRLRLGGITAGGFLDLAFRAEAGWVLVDHKSFPGLDPAEWAEKASAYGAQLAAYALALREATGERVIAAYIHLVIGGALVPMTLPSGAELTRFVARSLGR